MYHAAKYCFTRFSVQRLPAVSSVLLQYTNMSSSPGSSKKFTTEELKKRLTPMQYHVTQEKGTEKPFSGEYENNKAPGDYKCVVCGNLLFKSDHKFDSGSGWPSFYQTATGGAVQRLDDRAHGMKRIEAVCNQVDALFKKMVEKCHNKKTRLTVTPMLWKENVYSFGCDEAMCKAHLGHVFDDGPNPTGERFCMNSASLAFEKKK